MKTLQNQNLSQIKSEMTLANCICKQIQEQQQRIDKIELIIEGMELLDVMKNLSVDDKFEVINSISPYDTHEEILERVRVAFPDTFSEITETTLARIEELKEQKVAFENEILIHTEKM